jgi:hypothetical protein
MPFGNVKDHRLETDSDLKGYPLLKGDLGKGWFLLQLRFDDLVGIRRTDGFGKSPDARHTNSQTVI